MKQKRAMKLLFLSLLLLSISFVLAEVEEPSVGGTVGIGGEDVDEIQENIDKYNPVGDDGKFNASGFKPVKSKAEERIEKINAWLEDKASWFTFLFGMVPEISWMFFWSAWLFLLALFYFLIRPDITFVWLPLTGQKPRVIGAVLFLFVLGLNVIPIGDPVNLLAELAKIIVTSIKTAFVTSMVLGVIAIIVVILLALFAPVVLLRIGMWAKMRKGTAGGIDKERVQKSKEDMAVIEEQAKALETR